MNMSIERRQIKRALLSVSDKTGVAELAAALHVRGVELISTGGTAKALADAGLPVRDVGGVTGAPEMLDGRVKTLHPGVHGPILARRDTPEHMAALDERGYGPIDLVVVNLYPFEATVAADAAYDEAVEQIDIGGPAMIRAAAKNHGSVAVIVDPSDYQPLLDGFSAEEAATDLPLRKRLAAKAYARTASYDAAIAGWFANELGEAFPDRLPMAGMKIEELRYGENPHQQAAFYRTAEQRPGVATAALLQGKALSYNNIADADAAYELAADLSRFGKPAVAVIKHANPSGAALGDTLKEAYIRARDCDPTSAFGGVIALGAPLDADTAEEILKIFTEVVIAPAVTPEAAALFAAKQNVRLLDAGALPSQQQAGRLVRSVAGGFLAMDRDNGRVEASDLKLVTERAPSEAEMQDLLFAWTVAKHVKSNAIVYARGGSTVGVGAGQMSRVDSTRIAAQKAAQLGGEAGTAAKGSAVASDAFFPFADGLLTAAEAGATAIIQPGGSVRDEEVIAAADKAGLAMVFTGMRHFRH
ncbi:MAG: bifunctional phosphoribosylaminoimidazolecarboxamide formyltransferase/IMP cyclohydrolase [Neomegalonema sp.]|nr:bifunctional phosphoribosylaminoimidazolecarboxamide formyltransferase/IMP cyclohydrolase [Neomegalonema sp.]